MAIARCRRRFTADEYQRMGKTGILSENDRVELIEGDVVVKMTIGSRHNACVDRTNRAMVMGAAEKAIVRPQGSCRLNLFSEPEPDLVLLRPQDDFYASRLPGPADMMLVVEIADSSIAYDRDVKARLYAESGVPEYWLADLNDNLLICFTRPEGAAYRQIQQYQRGQSIAPQLLPECSIPVDVLLTE